MVQTEWPDFETNIDESIDPNQERFVIPVDEPDDAPPSRESLFTVAVDSREQMKYTFENIFGDSVKDDGAKIHVKTIRRALNVADYGIDKMPGILIERKSKEDLFGSMSSQSKRDNFIERLCKLSTCCRYSAVVIECNANDIFENPPKFTSFSPKYIYRTILSWQIKFPLVHWFFCENRDFAEQTTFRLLEKYFEDETDYRHQTKNNLIDNNIEAYKLGQLARKHATESSVPYPPGNPLRSSWLKGWFFASNNYYGGELGKIWDGNDPPPLEVAKKKKRSKKEGTSTDPMEEMKNQEAFKF